MLAHFWRLQRDVARMLDCYGRVNVSPLGSGALAGTSFGIDRDIPVTMLMMDGLTQNSIDAVSDRDFLAETVFTLSLMMIHLSSLCEELILWSSQEFGFARLPKELSSGSSMMPQKRNPDIPELVRGKSGRTVGHLISILTVLKSLPLAYNRDLQEDKENLFDVFDTVGASLHALTNFLAAIEFDTVRMRESANVGLMTATDLADFLVTRGVPFRSAHGITKEIAEMADGDLERFKELAGSVAREHLGPGRTADMSILDVDKSVGRRDSYGGTAPKAVTAQLREAEAAGRANKKRLKAMARQATAVDELIAG
jgi:argininosuccinate lyase